MERCQFGLSGIMGPYLWIFRGLYHSPPAPTFGPGTRHRSPGPAGKSACRGAKSGGWSGGRAVAYHGLSTGRRQPVGEAHQGGSLREAQHREAEDAARQACLGYAIGLGSIVAAEALANCGIDFILLDRQHGSWGEDSAIAALIAMHGGSAIPMARVSRNDYTMIGRLLDEGCMGIIVPMVHTVEDAKAAADACRLPPTGTRSWGWGRASLYGSDYPDTVNDQIFVAVQIESAAGRRERRGDHGHARRRRLLDRPRRHGALDGHRPAQGRARARSTPGRWRRSSRPARTPARSPASPPAASRMASDAPSRGSSTSSPAAMAGS